MQLPDDEAVCVRPQRAMRSRRIARCPCCGLYPGLCVCASLPRLAPRVEVRVLLHRKELFKSTNTGKLAAHMLEGATCGVRDGRTTEPAPTAAPGSFVLFPGEHALSLQEACARGITRLIVPDGTWQQAARMARRDPECATLPCVRVAATHTSGYRLRRNARPDGLCTLEAIAEALRVLEGDSMADALLAAFELWVARAELVRAGAHQRRLDPAQRSAPLGG